MLFPLLEAAPDQARCPVNAEEWRPLWNKAHAYFTRSIARFRTLFEVRLAGCGLYSQLV
jgi:hypothetical protein